MANVVSRAEPARAAPAKRLHGLGRSEALRRASCLYLPRPRPAVEADFAPRKGAAWPADVTVAVIDGPYDATVLSAVLARTPVNLGSRGCDVNPNSACRHGTFVMGLLGARRDAAIPGICPDVGLLHVPLFADGHAPRASVAELAKAISVAVAAGAKLINLSLAILGDEANTNRELADALDRAEASGVVLVAAAGNQGRLTTGQLLSHPTTVPVVAADAAGRLLPGCNFGPSVSRRGVAAFGCQKLGYGPGGETAVMSGTSVATAVVTGILALAWSARPNVDGPKIRSAVARLAPRSGPVPPLIRLDDLVAAIDQDDALSVAVASAGRDVSNCVKLERGTIMSDETDRPSSFNRNASPATRHGQPVIPAQGPGGCACGAPGGLCTCADGEPSPSRFVYVLGTVDIRIPDQSISQQLEGAARAIGIKKQDEEGMKQKPDEDLRTWCHRILDDPDGDARYVARQLCWLLTVEGQPAYYLFLRDMHDLKDLIKCLDEPKGHDLCLFVGSCSLVPIETCPGVTAPALFVDHLSAVKQETLSEWIKTSSDSIPKPMAKKVRKFSTNGGHTQNDFFNRLVQSADNFGDTDELRALNYLAIEYKPLYRCYADMLQENYTLDSIKVMRSRLWGQRRIVDPVFTFRDIKTGDVEKYFVRVDVSHLFPVIVNHIAEYFDR